MSTMVIIKHKYSMINMRITHQCWHQYNISTYTWFQTTWSIHRIAIKSSINQIMLIIDSRGCQHPHSSITCKLECPIRTAHLKPGLAYQPEPRDVHETLRSWRPRVAGDEEKLHVRSYAKRRPNQGWKQGKSEGVNSVGQEKARAERGRATKGMRS